MPAKKTTVKKVNIRPKKVPVDIIDTPSPSPYGSKSWSGGTREEIEKMGAYPITVVKVEEAAKMLSEGRGRQEVIEHLKTKYKMTHNTAQKYYVSACHYLIPDDEEFKSGLIKQNVERLEKIITDSLNDGDRRMAKEAIAELNKMLGVTGGNNVVINKDLDNNLEQIVISFGG